MRLSLPIIFILLLSCSEDSEDAQIVIEESIETYADVNYYSLDLESLKLQGKVKSVNSSIESTKGNETINLEYMKFDSLGYKTIVNKYNMDGTPQVFCEYKYDQANLISFVRTKNFSENNLEFEEYYEYDKQGNKIKSKLIPSDSKLFRYSIFFNNSEKQLTEQQDFNTKDELINKRIYEYDNLGNLIRTYDYKANGDRKQSFHQGFNENNKLVSSIVRNFSSEVISNILYKYDSYGNIIEWNWLDKRDEISHKRLFTYDKYLNITKEENINSKDKTISTKENTYTYDSIGNWTSRILIRTEGSIIEKTIINRNIDYYK